MGSAKSADEPRAGREGYMGYVAPEPGKTHAGGSGSSATHAERVASAYVSAGEEEKAAAIVTQLGQEPESAELQALKEEVSKGEVIPEGLLLEYEMAIPRGVEVHEGVPYRASAAGMDVAQPLDITRVEGRVIDKEEYKKETAWERAYREAGEIKPKPVTVGFWSGLGAAAVKGIVEPGATLRYMKERLIAKLGKSMLPYETGDVKELERLTREFEKNQKRILYEQQKYNVDMPRILAKIQAAKTEAEIQSIMKKYPGYKFTKRGDVYAITYPKLDRRSVELSKLKSKADTVIKRIEKGEAAVSVPKVRTVGLEFKKGGLPRITTKEMAVPSYQKGAGLYALGLPLMPLEAMAGVQKLGRKPVTTVKAIPTAAAEAVAFAKKYPMYTLGAITVQVAAMELGGRLVGKIQKPSVLKTTPLGTAKQFTVSKIKEGVMTVKGKTLTRYKQQVMYGKQPFGKAAYYRVQRTFELAGKPEVYKAGFEVSPLTDNETVYLSASGGLDPEGGTVYTIGKRMGKPGIVITPKTSLPTQIQKVPTGGIKFLTPKEKPITVRLSYKQLDIAKQFLAKKEALLYKYTFKGATKPSPAPKQIITAKGYGLTVEGAPLKKGIIMAFEGKEGFPTKTPWSYLEKAAPKKYEFLGLKGKVITKTKVPIKIKKLPFKPPRVVYAPKTFVRTGFAGGFQLQKPIITVTPAGKKYTYDVKGVSQVIKKTVAEPRYTIVKGKSVIVRKPPKPVSWGADVDDYIPALQKDVPMPGGIAPMEKGADLGEAMMRAEQRAFLLQEQKPLQLLYTEEFISPAATQAAMMVGVQAPPITGVTAKTSLLPLIGLTQQKVETKQLQITQLTTKQASIQKQLQKSVQKQKSLQATLTSTMLGTKTATAQQQAQIQQQVQQQVQQQQQLQKQLQKQLQVQKQITTTVPITALTPFTYVPPPPGVPPPRRADILKRAIAKVEKRVPGFQLFIRREQVFRPVGKPMPKWMAARKGAEITRRTLAATFKLAPAGVMIPGVKKAVTVGAEFRPYKVVRGRKVPTPLQWVERRRYRLAEPSEISEIQMLKARKPRKIKKKKKGGFWT